MKNFIEKIKEDKISEYSAASAYFIILSIIPFMLVFISLIQYIDIDKNTLINYAKQIIPNSFEEMSLNIIEEIYSKTITSLSVSIIFTLWSASKGFFFIIKGIDKIYKVSDKSYFHNKFKSLFFTILFMTLLILTLIILVLGNYVGDFLNSIFKNSRIANIIKLVIYFRQLGLTIVIFLIFLLLYKFLSNTTLKKQILGSIFVTIAWYVLSYGFSIYVELNEGFSLLYGSLTTIILFMIWTYFLIYVIFLGAEINSYFKG